MTIPYNAPLHDIQFALETSANLAGLQSLNAFEDCSDDLVSAVLTEAGKLASEVMAPINQSGDEQGCRLEDGVVTTPEGWKPAYQSYQQGGWMGLGFGADHGGQGMPDVLSTAVNEIWHSSNMAFSLCPLLTQGAIEAIITHASDEVRGMFLEPMIEGRWSGTMNLTEPQAGSDLGLVRTSAVVEGDHYLIKGQKIFITYGEQDLTENIVHLVLARLPDAPEGVKGISLFAVPKYLVTDSGAPGVHNDLECIKIEHKLGIHGSPTCVMSYGDNQGATGYLVGQPHAGLACMFTMMNKARHAVGLEGLSIAERSFQQALAFANERIQSNPAGSDVRHAKIIEHQDIRRMLMLMKSNVEAMRGLCYWHAACMDRAASAEDEEDRKASFKRLEFLTPIVKGWCTEMANEITSYGVQVHGGMGYIEETGAAQHYRDARISTIYEGTTAIQANDLLGRKLVRDKGDTVHAIIDEALAFVDTLEKAAGEQTFAIMKSKLRDAIDEMSHASEWLLENAKEKPALVAAGSVNYLALCGLTLSGLKLMEQAWYAWQQLATENEPDNKAFLEAKIATAQFYASQMLPRGAAYEDMILRGSQSVLDAKL